MAAKKSANSKQSKLGKGLSKEDKVGLGIGLTAAAVAAAGAYFLYGSKKAAQNRKKVKGWSLKAKGEILEALEKAEQITEGEYDKLVEAATKAYGTVERASKGEIKDFKMEMLGHWKDLQKNKAIKRVTGKSESGPKTAARSPRKKAPATASKKSASKK
jgi:hypothetical protein